MAMPMAYTRIIRNRHLGLRRLQPTFEVVAPGEGKRDDCVAPLPFSSIGATGDVVVTAPPSVAAKCRSTPTLQLNPDTNEWEAIQSMASPRKFLSAAVLPDGSYWVTGGFSDLITR